jgi:hypothetical protein
MARRREEEARRQREEEFLRSSLRGSEKLKALEEPRTPTPTADSLTNETGNNLAAQGAVNSAFTMDDTVSSLEPRYPSSRPAYREDLGRVVGMSRNSTRLSHGLTRLPVS